MNKEQLIHYLQGGKFTATYSPKMEDVKELYKKGKTVVIYQNILNTPIGDGEYQQGWSGQYRFSSPDIYGWSPEEDFDNIEIINEFINFPEPTVKYVYRMTYTEESQILPNFGKGNFNLPLVVYRDYNNENDDYVRKLSKPQATKIEKRIVNLLKETQPEWQEIKI